jgi:hypothetical protein
MRTRAVRWPAAVAATVIALVAAAAPSPGRGAVPWTLTASPLTVGTGAPTTFTLSATSLDPAGVRCIVVSVPASFTVDAAARSGTAGGKSWTVSRAGNVVSVVAGSGGDRLAAGNPTISFTIHATALVAGVIPWPATAYPRTDCRRASLVLAVPPTIVVTGPPVTPAPTPTPTRTPVPTPTPPVSTPTPTATPVGSATPEPTPTEPLASASSPATPSASAVATPRGGATEPPSAASGPFVPRPPGTGLGPGGTPGRAGEPTPRVPRPGSGAGLHLAAAAGPTGDAGEVAITGVDLVGGVGTWAIPVATLGLPGLLLAALWILAQTIGALAWIPAVRRLRGDEDETQPG